METYTIGHEELNNRSINFKFEDMYRIFSANALSAKYKPEMAEEVVRNASKLFSRVLYSTFNKIKDTEIIKSTQLLKAYSAYLASKVVLADLSSQSEYESDVADARIAGNGVVGKQLIDVTAPQITLVKKSLDNLVNYLHESQDPKESGIEYFQEYSNQASHAVESNSNKKIYEKLSNMKWDIVGYKIEGIEKPKKIIQVDNSNGAKSTIKNEESRFYTSLKPMTIPEEKILTKDQIVGDKSVVEYLERMVKCLFLYNPKYGVNPMKMRGLFKNKILIQGREGTGKGVLSFYAMDYARRFNENLNAGLMITTLDIHSHWKDGRIQKLTSQFDQLANNNQIYFVYEDELDGILKNENSQIQSQSNLNDLNEFNKFMDGEYPDRGNYLLIGNVNDSTNLRKSNLSRFHLINWKGASSPGENSDIFRNFLGSPFGPRFVNLSNKDLNELGELAYDNDLNGRQIADISKSVLGESFLWDQIDEIYELRSDIEKQYKRIDEIHDPIYLEHVQNETIKLIENHEGAQEDSKTFNSR